MALGNMSINSSDYIPLELQSVSTPPPHTDSDEVVMKSTSGYVRRPLSALWSWIKSKMDDEIITITKTLTLTTEWQDTGIMGADLPSGTYVVSCAPQKVVCSIYRDIYCGVMQ